MHPSDYLLGLAATYVAAAHHGTYVCRGVSFDLDPPVAVCVDGSDGEGFGDRDAQLAAFDVAVVGGHLPPQHC